MIKTWRRESSITAAVAMVVVAAMVVVVAMVVGVVDMDLTFRVLGAVGVGGITRGNAGS